MIYLQIQTDGLDDLAGFFHDLEIRLHDVMPLAHELASIVATQNMAARMAGLDRYGEEFAPLAEATWRRHPHRGMGPPLAGMEMASRIISGFEVEAVPATQGADVIGGWPGMDEFVIYHITGTKHMPARNPAGISLPGWVAVADAFDLFLDNLAGRA